MLDTLTQELQNSLAGELLGRFFTFANVLPSMLTVAGEEMPYVEVTALNVALAIAANVGYFVLAPHSNIDLVCTE